MQRPKANDNRRLNGLGLLSGFIFLMVNYKGYWRNVAAFPFLLTIKISNLVLAASLARSGIAGLVVGDLLALPQYRGKAPRHVRLDRWLGACRQGDPSVRTIRLHRHGQVRCAGNSDLRAQANLSGHSAQLMEEPLL